MKRKPRLSFRQIWNMCFGFLGMRIAKAVGTMQTPSGRYVYNEVWQLLSEYGDAHRDYVWLPASRSLLRGWRPP